MARLSALPFFYHCFDHKLRAYVHILHNLAVLHLRFDAQMQATRKSFYDKFMHLGPNVK